MIGIFSKLVSKFMVRKFSKLVSKIMVKNFSKLVCNVKEMKIPLSSSQCSGFNDLSARRPVISPKNMP
jgi:hypothetical protein